jgi:hypothetical protein
MTENKMAREITKIIDEKKWYQTGKRGLLTCPYKEHFPCEKRYTENNMLFCSDTSKMFCTIYKQKTAQIFSV